MHVTYRIVCFFMVLFCYLQTEAQVLSNLRVRSIPITADTLVLDTLSLVPGSEWLRVNGINTLDSSFYTLDAVNARLILFRDKLDELPEVPMYITVQYRVFPLQFNKPYFHKEYRVQSDPGNPDSNPFKFTYTSDPDAIFNWQGLNKTGSISRGVSFGNNQDLAVNSNMNLQLSGKLTENLNITAAISDDNIPIQPDGNTQLLQEFDQVYIKVYDEQNEVVAGDFFLNRPSAYFMNFNKRGQGASYKGLYKLADEKNKTHQVRSAASAAISKGKFARNVFMGVEGNQGPYRLSGAENETFIVVLSGTEKIYVDGKLLERGQDFDYIIDYNTAEITFTPNFLITQFSRIVAEFQYSDRNYARSMFYGGTEYQTPGATYRFHIYSEQDAKNQPLRQELDTAQRRILQTVGDSLYLAVFPGIDSVPFSNDQVLYKRIDTLVNNQPFTNVYVYSTSPDSAFYKLSFSQTGQGKGNYVQIQSTANGRVFKWVAPVNGIPQGNYEPVIQLISPKKTQMAIMGSDIKWGKKGIISLETAISNNDMNTFSSKDNNDNAGYAFKLKANNAFALDTHANPIEIIAGADIEFTDLHFTQLERFRTVEFERDWNVSNLNLSGNQYILGGFAGLQKKNAFLLKYGSGTFISEGAYIGWRNQAQVFAKHKSYELNANGSLVETRGNVHSAFLRHNATLSKQMGAIRVGVYEEVEQNKFSLPQSDTLLGQSFQWNIVKTFIETADTAANGIGLSYQYREDLFPRNNQLAIGSLADDIQLEFRLQKNKNSRLRVKTTYRNLRVVDSLISIAKPEETVLGRIEYMAVAGKGLLTSGTYYETGSGLELRREFRFLEVQPGQGTHTWIDYNDNGIKELNEFEIAQFSDQANYIKVFTPTNSYVRVYTYQFNQTLFLRPEVKWGNKKGVRKMLSRFSDKASYRIDRKSGSRIFFQNPFDETVLDTALVAIHTSLLNTLYFNRTSPVYGFELNYQDNKGKNLLINGFESRANTYSEIRGRWNFLRMYGIQALFKDGEKLNFSEFFANRNYRFRYQESEPRFSIQPGTQFRLTFLYSYTQKISDTLYGNEKAFVNKAGVELRYIALSKGSIMLNVNAIDIRFTGIPQTAVAYDMLEALQPGRNYTWSVIWQRNLSNHMQLNLTYNGRQSEGVKMIHTGGIQVRAFF